jgi:hypothetical protein
MLSVPLTFFVLISAGIFALLCLIVWKHNHSVYQRRFIEWGRFLICSRCGTVVSANGP